MAADLISIDAARAAVLERVRRLPPEDVPLEDALGRVLAEDVASPDAVPGFDNSAMDGYAVRAADTAAAEPAAPAVLALIGESRAGRPARTELGPGEAIAISTGAAMPAGADAVVRVERTTAEAGEVRVEQPVSPGADLRRAGEDIHSGERVLAAGASLGPAELGVLASVGRASVACARRPRVGVLTTGDELVEPGAELRPGAIRNSNGPMLRALVERAGGLVALSEVVADDPVSTRDALERALESEVVIVSGGVSVGRHDHVRPALAELGAEQAFWGVALRPGRPTWFGSREETLAFGLPGNPVSALVTFVLFVRPAIAAMLGARDPRPQASAILDAPYEKHPGRAHMVRCRLELGDDGWHATPTGPQGSHVLTSVLGADALAVIPAASASVAAGERVRIELLAP